MITSRSVQTCHWSTPTLFLPWPHWYLASQHEWCCVRTIGITVLPDPSICGQCSCWMPPEPPTATLVAPRG
jgi:hypothetical protein